MSKTATMTVERIADDPGVQAAERRRAETRRTLQEAKTAHARLAPEVGQAVQDLDLEEAKRAVKRAEQADAAAAREAESAERGAHERVVAGRQPGRLDLLRQLLTVAEAAQAAARALEQYDAETAARVGVAPGPAVAAKLVELGGAIEEIRREIDGPREPPPLALAPGKVRVHVVVPFSDKERVRRYPGVEILDEADAQKALEEKWAVPVERGA